MPLSDKLKELKPDLKSKDREKSPKKPGAVIQNRLELLITIVNRPKAEYYIDLLGSFDVNMQLVTLGQGTYNLATLRMLGLTESEKAVLIGVIRADKIEDAMYTLGQKFDTIRNGKGVAFTVPLTGVIGTLIFGFLSNNRMLKENKENEK